MQHPFPGGQRQSTHRITLAASSRRNTRLHRSPPCFPLRRRAAGHFEAHPNQNQGDIRFLGAAGAGPLPLDRRHQLKIYGNYLLDMGLNLGLGFNTASGTPLTAFAANPVYESDARFGW